MWEIERLKLIKQKDEEDNAKKEEQKEVCQQMIEQMKEKERKKLHEREVDELEGLEIAKAVRIAEHHEKQQALAQKHKVALHKQQINNSNLDHQMLRQQKIIEEKNEDDKILQYNMEKAQKEAEFVAEQKRKKEEKEKETQRLREM